MNNSQRKRIVKLLDQLESIQFQLYSLKVPIKEEDIIQTAAFDLDESINTLRNNLKLKVS